MAVRGPKNLDPPAPLPPQHPEPEPVSPPSTPLGPRPHEDDKRRERDEAAAQLSGEGRIGDPTLTADEFGSLGTLVAARHVMALLARRRKEERDRLLAEVGDLLLAQKDSPSIRRILLQMGEVGSIVDIYPLEVLDYVLQKRPDVLPGFEYGPVILNKEELEAQTFAVEELIRIKVPLSLRMRAFALEGGGDPGYCFAPGGPAEYHLEVASPGDFRVLVRGEIRKRSLVDRVILRIAEGPDDRPRW